MDCFKIKKNVKHAISKEFFLFLGIGIIFFSNTSSLLTKSIPRKSKKERLDKKKHLSKKEIDKRHSKIVTEMSSFKKRQVKPRDPQKQLKARTIKEPKAKLKKHDVKGKSERKTIRFWGRKSVDNKAEKETIDVGLNNGEEKKNFKWEISSDKENKKLIDKRTGFGWKELGTRKIVFDTEKKEYLYEVVEPPLTVDEEESKNKLISLFKKHADIDVFGLNFSDKRKNLEEAFEKLIVDNRVKLDDASKDKIFYYIFREFLGYGRIDILMTDEGIEDISCDGHGIPVFIFHKKYESIKTNVIFDDDDELDSFVVKLAQMCGKQISVYEPVVDGKLYDGSRLQTTLGRTITMRSTFTIRRFREDPLTPVDLIANNTMSLDMAAFFWLAIEKGVSILFCGGTATGKTTMLNALSLFVPSAYKIVSIEDTREINLPHENWIAGTTRSGFSALESAKTGRDIDMYDLIRVALRQRPRVIIVGEVRGKEAYTLFQAMTTGHLSYSTVHASDMHSLIQRLENAPIDLPRALLTSLDMIVFLNSVTVKGLPVRRITNVTEIIKLDPGTNRLVTMTPFKWISEGDDRFENSGGSRILYQIKLENGWDDVRLNEELQNRMFILDWMIHKNLRSYEDVGRVVSAYLRDPSETLKKAKEASK
ncbi:MAG: Flp pilus assembly complex ATPase component TadA [Thermoplasmatales archaeon]|nr:MAG: Flp pilus assembly complex ATPase component TadA [Thermoplasmatales archaeon]